MARELAEQLLHLAQSVQDSALLVRAYFALRPTLFHLGEFALALTYVEQANASYNPKQHRSSAFLQDPAVGCFSYAAWILWSLGYPNQALESIHKALTLAQELSHPVSFSFSLDCAAFLHQLRREEQAAQAQAEAAITLATSHGFPFWLGMETIFRGWALIEQSQETEGIAQVRQGLAVYQATGAGLGRPHFLALLAEAYGQRGQAEEGLSVLTEAFATVDKTEEREYEAELYRLKGELTLKQSSVQCLGSSAPPKQKVKGKGRKTKISSTQHPIPNTQVEAEACFQQAIAIARRQEAKSWELRATTSLARLWQQQGKQAEARQLLTEIYNWCAEGFDTKDLQEAKALLEDLAR